MEGTATGVIFVEQKVLIQFSELQRATQLDANKQVLLLLQLYNCVKSFEMLIKGPEVTTERTVMKDFFSKLSAFIVSPQEDGHNEMAVVMPKTEPLTDDPSNFDDSYHIENLQDDDAVMPLPKTELLNDDLLDGDCPEHIKELPEDNIQENSEKKDELSTMSVPGTYLSSPDSKLTSSTASRLNEKFRRKHKSHPSSTNSSSTATAKQPRLAKSSYDSDDSESVCCSSKNGVVLKKEKIKAKTKIVYASEIRRSSRLSRTPVKLDPNEFVGLHIGRSNSGKKSEPKFVKQSVTKSSMQFTVSPAKKDSAKTLKKAPVKSVKQVMPKSRKQIALSSGKKDAQKSPKHSAAKLVKQDVPVSPELTEISPEKKAIQKSPNNTPERLGRKHKQSHVGEITLEEDALKSLEESLRTSVATQESVEILTEMTSTKISNSDISEEENKDSSIEESENSHSGDLKYICAVCNLQFDELGQYVDHIIHHSEVKHEQDCVECGMHLKTKSALIQHLRIHQPQSVTDITCPTCGRRFLKKAYLKSHMLRHTGDKNILCDLCPATFYEKKNLYVHYNRVHLGKRVEPKFFCSLCPFQSHRQRDIERHSVVHSKTKNYVCDICGARLAHFTSLAIHKRLHSGNKRFKCATCGKEFFQKISLQNHERIHSGERPFKCDICHRGFQTSSHLSRHKITHSQELLFQCQFCDRRFARPFQLKKHVKEMHTEPTVPSTPVEYESVEIEVDPEHVSLQDGAMSDNDIQYESVVIEYME